MSDEKDFDLEKEYNNLKDKYSLPDFDSVSQDFDIEKAVEKESNFILRDIRRAIHDKLSGYMHLVENLINPNNTPMFILSAIKNLNGEDRKVIKEIYTKLSKFQIDVLRLDTVYSEEGEAKYIIDTHKSWQDIKEEFLSIIDKFGENITESDNIHQRGYFG